MKKQTVDTRNLACPKPVIVTKKALEQMDFDELTILIDNDVALANVKRVIQKLGFKIDSVDQKEAIYHVIIRNTNKEDAAASDSKVSQEWDGKVILFLSSYMGRGDDELGSLLMKGFVFALTETTTMPTKLLFMNSGVKMCVEGAESLANLQQLEQKGVEILVCGTCLNFFELSDRVKVGKVSNMYDITEAMSDKEQLVTVG